MYKFIILFALLAAVAKCEPDISGNWYPVYYDDSTNAASEVYQLCESVTMSKDSTFSNRCGNLDIYGVRATSPGKGLSTYTVPVAEVKNYEEAVQFFNSNPTCDKNVNDVASVTLLRFIGSNYLVSYTAEDDKVLRLLTARDIPSAAELAKVVEGLPEFGNQGFALCNKDIASQSSLKRSGAGHHKNKLSPNKLVTSKFFGRKSH